MIIYGKNYAIDADIQWYKKIRKLATGKGEDYADGCLLDYNYIKNHYRLIAVDISRQKELDADPKAILHIEFFRKLQKLNIANNNVEYMFILTILEKIKETRLNFSQGSVTVLWNMTNYQEVRVKLTTAQLNKVKSAAIWQEQY